MAAATSGTVDAAILAELRGFGSATVHEVVKGSSACDPVLHAVYPSAAVAGPAFTVQGHPGDNLAVHHALEAVAAGQVLVIAVGGHLAGYWGEVLTVAAQARDVAGLVIDGGVRDTGPIERLDFPTFARGTCIRGTGKHHPAVLGGPVMVAGTIVHTGDIVVADRDGVCIVPQESVVQTLTKARQRSEDEQNYLRRLRAGETTVQILGLTPHPSRNG